MAGGVWDVVMYGVAMLAAAWIGVPAVAFALGWMPYRTSIQLDPALAEPTAPDSDYERRFGQFAALGYRALGLTWESCWFMNPITWHWRSFQGIRWMIAADGKTLVSFHRLLAEEPVRFGATTLFEDHSMVRTTCPGAGLTFQDGNYLRMELRGVEPVELLAKHEIHAMAFSMDGNRKVKEATLDEVVQIDTEHDLKALKRMGGYGPLGIFFLLPALAVFSTGAGDLLRRGALATCCGAAVFAFHQFIIARRHRRRRVMASHSAEAAMGHDMRRRYERAKELLDLKQYDEATAEFVWLWDNIERVDPGMQGVRVSFMTGEIARLIAEHAPARARFAALRDRAAAAADASSTAQTARTDWAVLNKALGEEDRTLAWFDQTRDDPSTARAQDRLALLLEPLLKDRGRWADLGRLVADPMAKLEFQHSVFRSTDLPMMRTRMGEAAYAQMQQVRAKMFRGGVADLVLSLRAAGRHEDAVAIRDRAVALDPSEEMRQALERTPATGPALN